MSKRRSSGGAWIICLLAIVIGAGFLATMKKSTKPQNEIENNVENIVLSANIQYNNNEMTLDLISGEVRTNVQVDSFSVQSEGIGLGVVESTMTVGSTPGVYVYTLTPTEEVLTPSLDYDKTITIKLFAISGGNYYLADERDVLIKSSYTPCY